MNALSASATVTINALAMKKRRDGEKIYNFSAGDPVLKNHPKIIGMAIKHAEHGVNPYPPVEGIPELRRLAAEWMNVTCQTHYSKENVLVTCGGKFALFASIYALLEKDEEVLIPAPYWVSYPDIVKMAGGTPRMVSTSPVNGWKMTVDDMLLNLTQKTKILILNNAANPTGILYTKEEIRDILNTAKKANLIVISDEVYSGLVYDKHDFVSCGAFPEHRENVVIVQSCSKNFGMTGWRVGFVLGQENVIARLSVLQGQSTTGTPLMSQWAAVGALENAEEVNKYVKDAMKNRRDLFVNTYNSLFAQPVDLVKSALYAFVSMASMGVRETNSAKFCEKLIASDNIALVPGIAFGKEGYVRFAYSETEEEIHQALHVLYKAVNGLLRASK